MSLLGIQRLGSGPTLVWLHGFTQTKDSAHQFRSILAGTGELLTLDLPGHGENAAIRASLTETAALLAEVLPDEPFVLGGYSYGARVALHFALAHPQRLRGLLLLGATRGIEDPVERSERRRRDEELANRIETVGTEAFLDEWLAQPMFATLPEDAQERASRSRDPRGLADSLRSSGTGTQSWLAPELPRLTTPLLALAGSNDSKFLREAVAIADGVMRGQSASVANASHAAHLEQPASVAELVETFRRQL
jgi:2-succinyl-6-hydroxy-2,4-cyclohexadiene-1-carboxylate synthase